MYDPDPLRVVLVGSHSFGCAVRNLLLSRGGIDLVKVLAPAGDVLAQSPLVPVTTAPPTADLIGDGVDLIIAAHNHRYLPAELLAKARLGGISYHPSLLPLHRGRDAVYWTIRDRDRITGGSVYWLDDMVDGGQIAAREWCFVRPDDTPSTLWRRELYPMGLRLIQQVLDDCSADRLVRMPQDHALATWEPAMSASPLATRSSP
jgi:methionyl-tRNA formyltransferase